jgi:FAD/FMN-containing dehydrogenase
VAEAAPRETTPFVVMSGADTAHVMAMVAVHWFQIRTMGGAIADVAPEATAFAHRDAQFQITAMGANAQRVDRYWDELRPHLSGTYLRFETDTDPDRVADAFPPSALRRLRTLKSELDPGNLFRDNFNITIEPATTGSAS